MKHQEGNLHATLASIINESLEKIVNHDEMIKTIQGRGVFIIPLGGGFVVFKEHQTGAKTQEKQFNHFIIAFQYALDLLTLTNYE